MKGLVASVCFACIAMLCASNEVEAGIRGRCCCCPQVKVKERCRTVIRVRHSCDRGHCQCGCQGQCGGQCGCSNCTCAGGGGCVDGSCIFRLRNRDCSNGVCSVSQHVKGVSQFDWWPFDNEEVKPDTPPQPDPAPAPDQPVTPPQPDSKVPTDPAELNTFIAKQLGGYVRANHEKNGVTLDIYQARGKQRIVWVVADCNDWMKAVGEAFFMQYIAGTSNAGLALVCDCPPPVPDPIPVPPVPDSPVPLPDPNSEPVLYRNGGCSLISAEKACNRSGLWLVALNRASGELSYILYGDKKVSKGAKFQKAPKAG